MNLEHKLNQIEKEIQEIRKTQELIYAQIMTQVAHESLRYIFNRGETKLIYRNKNTINVGVTIHNLSDKSIVVVISGMKDCTLQANSHLGVTFSPQEEIFATSYENNVDILVNVL